MDNLRSISAGTNSVSNAITIRNDYTQVDGLQTNTIDSASAWPSGIVTSGTTNYLKISNNIVKGTLSGTSGSGGAILGIYIGVNPATVFNNILYGWNNGAYNSQCFNVGGVVYAYNNTGYGCKYGFWGDNSAAILKNNIVQATTNGYGGTYSGSSANNLSDHADAPGSNPQNSKTVSFVDATNKDFHLAISDTAAKYAGVNLSQDASLAFSNDIDGQQRSGDWSIGADQFSGGSEETQQTAAGASTLVGYWSFDSPDINGTTATDRSATPHSGTITGATLMMGKIGSALSFNGASNKVSVGNTGQSVGSISFW